MLTLTESAREQIKKELKRIADDVKTPIIRLQMAVG